MIALMTAVGTLAYALVPGAGLSTAIRRIVSGLLTRFGLTPAQIGWVWVSISLAGLTGAALARWLSDRLGKRAFAFRLWILMTSTLVVLPYSPGLTLAVGLSFLMTVGLEAGWVAFQALASEIAPSAGGTLVAAMSFGSGIASLATSLSGRLLWTAGGFSLTAGYGAAGGLIATLLVGFALPHIGQPKALTTAETEAVTCSPESISS